MSPSLFTFKFLHPFIPSPSSLHPSSFILHPLSFILHPSPFIFHPSSFNPSSLHPFISSSLHPFNPSSFHLSYHFRPCPIMKYTNNYKTRKDFTKKSFQICGKE